MTHVDLNLLLALDALIEHASVQDAAAQLHVTPSAMSRSLTRARAALGDDVLVRNGRSMQATPRALQVHDELHDVVRRATALLTPSSALDLRALRRVFTVTGNDALLSRLAPDLLAGLPDQAPGVSLRLIGEGLIDRAEVARGQADVAVGDEQPAIAGIRTRAVDRDRLVVVLREGHPLAAAATLPLDAFAGAAQVTVSRRGRLVGPVDAALAERGMERRVVASLPSVATALAVVRSSDVLAAVPASLARGEAGIVTREIPLPLPRPVAVVSWHARDDSDPAHSWFRERVVEVLEQTE